MRGEKGETEGDMEGGGEGGEGLREAKYYKVMAHQHHVQ